MKNVNYDKSMENIVSNYIRDEDKPAVCKWTMDSLEKIKWVRVLQKPQAISVLQKPRAISIA